MSHSFFRPYMRKLRSSFVVRRCWLGSSEPPSKFGFDLAGADRAAGDSRPAVDIDQRLRAEKPGELGIAAGFFRDKRLVELIAVVDLDRNDLAEFREDFFEARLEGRQETQVDRRDAQAVAAKAIDCFFDCALGRSPTDDEQVT